MYFVWTPFAVVGLIAVVVAWGAAVFILRTTPDPLVRRRFALLLFAEGLMILTSFSGPIQWIGGDASFYRTIGLVHMVNDCLIVAVYLPTLAAVVDSPMVRLFKSGLGMLIPLALGVVGAILTIVRPDLAMIQVFPAPDSFGGFMWQPGPVNGLIFALLMLGYFYGLLVSIFAWTKADTKLSRRRNGYLALAFGTRDLFWGATFLFGAFLTSRYPLAEMVPTEYFVTVFWLVQTAAWGLIVYIVLLAYGIASEHLFDIDLKVKWTIQRGTVAAAYVSIFFIISEGTATFLSEQVGTVIGLIATGLLLFALAPIQRFAERFSDNAMPNVRDTPEYRKFRKMEIYGEAFLDSQRRETPSAAQRAALESLRLELDLSDEDTSLIEAQLGSA